MTVAVNAHFGSVQLSHRQQSDPEIYFDVSLNVHLSITLANDQLDAQIFNIFITILYVFRAISCSSSGGQILLTLRRIMSYIYIYMEHPFLMFLDHTQRRSTVGRTPLDE